MCISIHIYIKHYNSNLKVKNIRNKNNKNNLKTKFKKAVKPNSQQHTN